MAHDPAQTPEEIFDDSPVVRSFLQEAHQKLREGITEMALPANYPDDFVKRTIEHFSAAGWKVSDANLGKLSFAPKSKLTQKSSWFNW